MTNLPTLDVTGTQAAVYPSEEQLWVIGPQINDSGDQGVSFIGAGQFAPPFQTPAPMTDAQVEAEEQFIHDVTNGPTSNGAYGLEWVNPRVEGVPNVGNWNYTVSGSPQSAMPYTGHDANIPSNPSSEQGWGVGPARHWARWPWEDSPNPARNGAHLRNGDFPWIVADSYLYERSGMPYSAQWDPYRRRRVPYPVVPMYGGVPFADVVPNYGGPPTTIPTLDMDPFGSQPVYPTEG